MSCRSLRISGQKLWPGSLRRASYLPWTHVPSSFRWMLMGIECSRLLGGLEYPYDWKSHKQGMESNPSLWLLRFYFHFPLHILVKTINTNLKSGNLFSQLVDVIAWSSTEPWGLPCGLLCPWPQWLLLQWRPRVWAWGVVCTGRKWFIFSESFTGWLLKHVMANKRTAWQDHFSMSVC